MGCHADLKLAKNHRQRTKKYVIYGSYHKIGFFFCSGREK